MVSDKNPTSGNGDKWAPSRINAPFEILQIQSLSSADLKVLLYLYSRDFKKKGKVWPGRKTIAEDTGCSERTVSRSISKLSALGIIRGEGGWRGSTTVYYLKYGDELRAAIEAIPSLAKKARENGRQIRKAEGGKGAKLVTLYGGGKGDKPGTLYSTKGCQIWSERVTNSVRKGAKLGHKTPRKPAPALASPGVNIERNYTKKVVRELSKAVWQPLRRAPPTILQERPN